MMLRMLANIISIIAGPFLQPGPQPLEIYALLSSRLRRDLGLVVKMGCARDFFGAGEETPKILVTPSVAGEEGPLEKWRSDDAESARAP